MGNSSGFGKGAWALLAVLAGFWGVIACSSVSAPPPAQGTTATAYQEGVPGGVVVNTLTVSARVTAVDQAKRRATLMGPDGRTFTVKAGPEAVNFDQVAVGDLVKLTVTEELVVYLQEGGARPQDGSAAMVALAPKGASPAGLVAETTQSTATVTAIDPAKRTATLRFEDGTTKTFPVRSDVDLSKRKVGEKVVFRATEMLAIKVEKP
jgi:hypothetical protein